MEPYDATIGQPPQLTVCCQNVGYYVKERKWFCKSHKKIILKNVDLLLPAGKLTAVMGPAGSGKTTLLNVLANRTSNQPTGTILYNGRTVTNYFLKKYCSMVMSKTIMHGFLTVEETLMNAAKFKLPHSSQTARQAKVDRIISELALHKCKNTYVGGVLRKGISSGEYKRLSIGVELLDDPSVLLLDEPTADLDSSLAWDLIILLYDISQTGKTVAVSIHQPRSQTFSIFDHLIVLRNGEIVYHGEPKLLLAHFNSIGLHISSQENPADLMMQYVCTRDEGNNMAQLYTSSETYQKTLKDIETHLKETEEAQHVDPVTEYLESNKLLGIKAWGTEFSTHFKKTLKIQLRNPAMLLSIILIHIIDSSLIGGIFFQLPRSVEGIHPINSTLITSEHLENPWGRTFVFGVDGDGTRPIADMFDFIGNREPQDQWESILNESETVLQCAHNKFGVSDLDYPLHRWDPIGPQIGWPDAEYKDPAEIISNIVTGLQAMHHLVYNFDWTEPSCFMNNQPLSPTSDLRHTRLLDNRELDPKYLSWWMGMMNSTYSYLDPLFTCAGLPPMGDLFEFEFPPALMESNFRDYPWDKCLEDPLHQEVRRYLSEWLLQENIGALKKQLHSLKLVRNDMQAVPDVETLQQRLIGLLAGNDTVVEEISSIFSDGVLDQCISPACDFVKDARDIVTQNLSDLTTTLSTVFNYSGFLFFMMGTLNFSTFYVALNQCQDRLIINRETANGMYRISSYYFAKNAADLIMQLVPGVFFTLPVYLLAGMTGGLFSKEYGLFLASVVCTNLACYGMGYFIGGVVPAAEVGVVAMPTIFTIYAVTAGFFIRSEDIPVYLHWLFPLNTIRHSFFTAVISQFPDGGSFGAFPNSVAQRMCGVETTFKQSAGILTILAVGFRIVGFFAVKFLHRNVGIE